jgi:hypothetical protein
MAGSDGTSSDLKVEKGVKQGQKSRMSTPISIMTEDKHLVLTLYHAYWLGHESEMSGKTGITPISFLVL